MAKIERSFVVNVPAEKIFSYLSDSTRLPEWIPGLFDVRDIKGKGADQRSSWTYKMMGIHFNGESVCIEYTPNERLAIKTMGGITSIWDWTFKSQGNTTLVNLVLEYNIPVTIIGNLCSRLILRHNEREADMAIANIKDRLAWREQFKFLR
jgi:uncharacterized membrane protein